MSGSEAAYLRDMSQQMAADNRDLRDQIIELKQQLEKASAAKAIVATVRELYKEQRAIAKEVKAQRDTARRALEEVELNLSAALGGAAGNTPQLVAQVADLMKEVNKAVDWAGYNVNVRREQEKVLGAAVAYRELLPEGGSLANDARGKLTEMQFIGAIDYYVRWRSMGQFSRPCEACSKGEHLACSEGTCGCIADHPNDAPIMRGFKILKRQTNPEYEKWVKGGWS